MELMIATGKAVPKLQLEHGLAVDRVYTGSFMTSLDMAGLFSWQDVWLNTILHVLTSQHCPSSGFSISIMKADETILQRLDAVTKAPYWPIGVDGRYKKLFYIYMEHSILLRSSITTIVGVLPTLLILACA